MARARASEVAAAYVEAINGQRLDDLIGLFAEGAKLTHPFGVFDGHDALREFYGDMVLPADTKLTVESVVVEGSRAVLELSARSPLAPDTPQYAIDLFEIDAHGKIAELRIYYRNFDVG